jgi:catalase
VELDAVLVAGAPAPAPDALAVRDEKAGAAGTTALDPRVVLLLEECFRHGKVIGAWGAGVTALDVTGCTGAAGVVHGETGVDVLAQVQEQLAMHRVWDRFHAGATAAG